jgi:hypothetical protein
MQRKEFPGLAVLPQIWTTIWIGCYAELRRAESAYDELMSKLMEDRDVQEAI